MHKILYQDYLWEGILKESSNTDFKSQNYYWLCFQLNDFESCEGHTYVYIYSSSKTETCQSSNLILYKHFGIT